jgi:hypothetical protein
MTKYEMLTKALGHLENVYHGPFLEIESPDDMRNFQIVELYNACQMFGAILEEMLKEDKSQ